MPCRSRLVEDNDHTAHSKLIAFSMVVDTSLHLPAVIDLSLMTLVACLGISMRMAVAAQVV